MQGDEFDCFDAMLTVVHVIGECEACESQVGSLSLLSIDAPSCAAQFHARITNQASSRLWCTVVVVIIETYVFFNCRISRHTALEMSI